MLKVMVGLCKYKDIAGHPNEGVHRHKVFGIAVVDLFMTMVCAAAIARYFAVSFITIFTALMVLAIVMHRLFCVNTTINKAIFGEV